MDDVAGELERGGATGILVVSSAVAASLSFFLRVHGQHLKRNGTAGAHRASHPVMSPASIAASCCTNVDDVAGELERGGATGILVVSSAVAASLSFFLQLPCQLLFGLYRGTAYQWGRDQPYPPL